MNFEQEILVCREMSREAGYDWAKDNGICVDGIWKYEAGEAFYEEHIVFGRGYGDPYEFWYGVVDYLIEKQETDFDIEYDGKMVKISVYEPDY